LGSEVQVDEVTVRKWVSTLNAFFFRLSGEALVETGRQRHPEDAEMVPSRLVVDPGSRQPERNLGRLHLLKAVELWTDLGLGEYDLFYIRDKQKREVDFLISKDGKPWSSWRSNLRHDPGSGIGGLAGATGAKHAFQVVFGLPFQAVDCFQYTRPMVVPAQTFLSQLP
jgi:hypothetical protein